MSVVNRRSAVGSSSSSAGSGGMIAGEGLSASSDGGMSSFSSQDPVLMGSSDASASPSLRTRTALSNVPLGSLGPGGSLPSPSLASPSFSAPPPSFPPTSFGSDSSYTTGGGGGGGGGGLNMRNDPPTHSSTPINSASTTSGGFKAPFEILVDSLPTERVLSFVRPYLPRQLRNTSVDEILNTLHGDDSRLFNSAGPVGRYFDRSVMIHAILIAISVVLMFLVSLAFDTYWQYEFFYLDPLALFYYWWFFAWGGLLSAVVWHFKGKKVFDEKEYIRKSLNSALNAVVEELGFRWSYIFSTMLLFSTLDLIVSHVGLALGFLCVIGGGSMAMAIGILVMLKENQVLSDFLGRYNPKHLIYGCLCLVAVGIPVAVLGWFAHSIAYVIWEYILIPVLDLVTLYTLSGVWKGFFGKYAEYSWAAANVNRFRMRSSYMQNKRYPMVMVHAMMLVQLFHTDGKKFDGIVGIINGWLTSLVFLSCTLHYGLLTTMVLHVLWNLECAAVGYAVQKSGWIRAGGVPHGVSGILGGF